MWVVLMYSLVVSMLLSMTLPESLVASMALLKSGRSWELDFKHTNKRIVNKCTIGFKGYILFSISCNIRIRTFTSSLVIIAEPKGLMAPRSFKVKSNLSVIVVCNLISCPEEVESIESLFIRI